MVVLGYTLPTYSTHLVPSGYHELVLLAHSGDDYTDLTFSFCTEGRLYRLIQSVLRVSYIWFVTCLQWRVIWWNSGHLFPQTSQTHAQGLIWLPLSPTSMGFFPLANTRASANAYNFYQIVIPIFCVNRKTKIDEDGYLECFFFF